MAWLGWPRRWWLRQLCVAGWLSAASGGALLVARTNHCHSWVSTAPMAATADTPIPVGQAFGRLVVQ